MPLQGFLSPETMRALDFFEQATDCFRKALNEVHLTSIFLQQPWQSLYPLFILSAGIDLALRGMSYLQDSLEMASKICKSQTVPRIGTGTSAQQFGIAGLRALC